ncbi:MAG TPA: HAD-IIIC family phosphatase [Candidatus Angelobacter sp.]
MQSAIESFSVAEKRSLLASLLTQSRSQLDLALTQERLWQLCQLQPETPLYNFQTSLELQGELIPRALEIAAMQVVQRHQVLQTSYGIRQGKPALSLVSPQQIAIALYDLSDLSPEEQEQRTKALGIGDAGHGFDLTRPPLFRFTLVRLASGKHRLYLTMHHIVSDFLSLDLFLFELGEFYSAELTGQPANLPPLVAGYQDFARMQQHSVVCALGDAHLQYWRRTLSGAKPIEWFSDHVRPATATGKACTEFFNIPSGLMQQIESVARGQQVTPFMVLLAGFNILLHACSGQDDLIVGSPFAGRIGSEYESLIGMFSYPLLMRTNMAGCHDFCSLLQRIRKVVLEAAEHADVPFSKVADCSGSQPALLFRAMLSYVSQFRNLHFQGLACRRRPTDRSITDLDLFMTIYPDLDEWQGVLEYSTDLFEPSTIRNLICAYIGILHAALAEPELSVAGLAARVSIRHPARLTIAATFTADPLLEVLKFWSRELDLLFTPVIAPYNQLFQQLLDPTGPLLSSGSALNVLLVRPEDWMRCAGPDFERQRQLLERSTQEFIDAVRGSIPTMNCPLKIYLCPPSPSLIPSLASAVIAAEQTIGQAFAGIDAIEILSAQACVEIYAAADVHDPQSDHTANIPYKPPFYAALATQIVRQLRVLVSRSCKVLVLDCDNTLWQGLCAEEGAQGVVISEGHRALQSFAVQQRASGVLICLISKNVPEHVLAVFRENSGMILKESDITTHRINWEPKSKNLESMAQELQLGLDSFVFLDDDARECAEVSERCPQVLTHRVPQDPAELPRFVRHLWAFDRETVSDEDRCRTAFYHDAKRRELARLQAPSLAEFLASLELRVEVKPATPDQILRIAQLSQRTNQFNASGLTFSQYSLQRTRQKGREVMAVEVRDRFGEYGMAGAVIYIKDVDSLTVEAFYLSCRVLGRGVEHRILSELGRIAHSASLARVRIHYNESPRNQPFRRFLEQLPGGMERSTSGSCVFILTAQDALQARLIPDDNPTEAAPESISIPRSRDITMRSLATLARLPHELSTVAQILGRINLSSSTRRQPRIAGAFAAPRDSLEKTIAAEWSAILRMDKVGRNDNFFELGGNSLALVQLNGNLISRFGRDISIPEMFQYPTVASLASYLTGQTVSAQTSETNIRGAAARAVLQNRKRQVAIQCSLNRVSQARVS